MVPKRCATGRSRSSAGIGSSRLPCLISLRSAAATKWPLVPELPLETPLFHGSLASRGRESHSPTYFPCSAVSKGGPFMFFLTYPSLD
jgi:hypothetical protein